MRYSFNFRFAPTAAVRQSDVMECRSQLCPCRLNRSTQRRRDPGRWRPLPPIIVIRMYPRIRDDLPLFGQPDHMHRWRVSPLLARPALQRRLKLPYRRVTRTPDRIERNSGARFTAMVFDLKPTVAAVQALRDGWRRLGRATDRREQFMESEITNCAPRKPQGPTARYRARNRPKS